MAGLHPDGISGAEAAASESNLTRTLNRTGHTTRLSVEELATVQGLRNLCICSGHLCAHVVSRVRSLSILRPTHPLLGVRADTHGCPGSLCPKNTKSARRAHAGAGTRLAGDLGCCSVLSAYGRVTTRLVLSASTVVKSGRRRSGLDRVGLEIHSNQGNHGILPFEFHGGHLLHSGTPRPAPSIPLFPL